MGRRYYVYRKNACATLDDYLGIAKRNDVTKKSIPETKNRGIILRLPNGEKSVIFIYPLVHKQDNTKNYFDTRDSGPHERAAVWNYALEHNLKYFCLGVNDQVDKYSDYVFSLECNEREIENLSGTEGGDRSATFSGNQIIIPNNYIPYKPFDRIRNNLGTFISVIHKDSLYDYLEIYDNRPYLFNDDLIEQPMLVKNLDEARKMPVENERLNTGANILLYGVPGSGKSWTIEHEYCKPDTHVERLVFYPDYTYSDFVGQILPTVDSDGQVSYEFTAGPFTNIIKDAFWHPRIEYILIIEEINRGNAPAIFGEVFQLLDRKIEEDDGTNGDIPVGTSEYGITNCNMAQIIYDDPTMKVRIPSNLSIIGTMNTSDQNVFTLDTAFQRRWEMRLIENNFDNIGSRLADTEILDTTVTWRNFCTEINNIVAGNGASMVTAEDKRLGAYFVHPRDLLYDEKMGNLTDGKFDALCKKEREGILSEAERFKLTEIREGMKQNRKFPEKVIKYLWDDAFKFNREEIFESMEYHCFEQVIRAFMYAKGFERFKIFKDNVRNAFRGVQEE